MSKVPKSKSQYKRLEAQGAMTNDLEKKARELAIEFCTESDDHDMPKENCPKCSEIALRIATFAKEYSKELEAEKDGLQEENEKLKGKVNMLKNYSKHKGSMCGMSALSGEMCNCGLKEILDERV